MKLNKILLASATALTACCAVAPITSCDDNNQQYLEHKSMFYKTAELSSTVFTFDASELNDNYKATLYSLEGILAQDKAQLFIFTGDNYRDEWFYKMKDMYGFSSVSLGKSTSDNPSSFWNVLKTFKDYYGVKYIEYKIDDGNQDISINNACTAAGIERNIILEQSLVEEYSKLSDEQKFGLTENTDVDAYTASKDIFEKYKDRLNNAMIINQKTIKFRFERLYNSI